MSRSAKYRAKYRAELVASIRACEAVLANAEKTLAAEYKKAFMAMVRAGGRYDAHRDLEADTEFDSLSLFGAEPDDVETAVDLLLSAARATLVAIRGNF